jgi:DNA polymerase V
MPVFALIDCNNFYASCERVFNPSLNTRPVVVLSNNDGCVIARSNEARALGIPMGMPWFQARPLCQRHNVAVFSSNYALYGDMSRRVMECIGMFSPDMEVYSIDEAFLQLDGFTHRHLTDYGQSLKKTVYQWTGIPVSVGIGPTKTLAKIANRVAKKRTNTGVFDITDPAAQNAVLPTIEVGDIWGIGSRWAARLQTMGIRTAADLCQADPCQIRQSFNVVAERIVLELQGSACLDLEPVQPRKNIMCSRSFGTLVTSRNDLLEAVACFAARAAEKLRHQHSRAGGVHVFLKTSRFRPDEPQYHGSQTFTFDGPSSDSRDIVRAARKSMTALYRPGFRYQKCGVMLLDIAPAASIQPDLFHTIDYARKDHLMDVIDSLNARLGKNAIFLAAQGTYKSGKPPEWIMRCDRRSQRYTTRWNEFLRVRC